MTRSPHSPHKQQPQQQGQYNTTNDDDLPRVPPAFPQPFTNSATAQYFPDQQILAAQARYGRQQYTPAALPISSRAYIMPHPQQNTAWVTGATSPHAAQYSGNGLPSTAVGSSSMHPNAAANGAVLVSPATAAVLQAGNSGYGVSYSSSHAYDGLPVAYDAASAPYGGSMMYGGSYGVPYEDHGAPLLTGGAGFVENMVFANRQVRHAFLRKVLCLVTIQLLLTAAIGVPIHAKKAVRHFLHANPWVCGLAVIVTFTVLLIMAWSESVRRQHPKNVILLGVFTLSNGLLIGIASATYSTLVLLLGLLIAAAVSLALIGYAAQTSVDFSASGGILYSAAVVLLVVVLADVFLGFKTLHLLIAGCGALLFNAYLVYDVQLIASGESWYQVSADEYVFATISVYTDVITLFMHVLQVLTQLQGGDDD